MKEQTNSSNLGYSKVKEEAKQEISMLDITIRTGIDQILEIGEFSMDKITEIGQGMHKAIGSMLGQEILEVTQEHIKIRISKTRQNNRGGYRGNYRNESYERGRSRSRERQYQGSTRRNDRSSSIRSGPGSRVSTNRDRIRCYKCREYDHFAKDCPTKIEKETDQIQQMFSLDEEQT